MPAASDATVPAPEPPAPPGGSVEVAPGIFLPESTLRFSFARSSGPGGQNVNKLSTKARLHVALADLRPRIGEGAAHRLIELAGPSRLNVEGDLVLSADESRSQRANREACLDRLRELLVRALHPPRPRKKTRPSKASKRRRLEAKKRRGEVKRLRGAAGHD